MTTVAAVPLLLLDVPRRTGWSDLRALSAGLAVARHAGAVAGHVDRARELSAAAAGTGLAILVAGGAPGVLAFALASRRGPVDAEVAAVLVASALGLDAAGGGRLRASATDPQAVAWLAAALGPTALASLARARPHLVGPVDGMPVDARDIANRVIAERAVGELERAGDRPAADALRALLASDHPLLLVDPDRGRVAQVVGDLRTAGHVAVLVPGMTDGLAGFATVTRRAAALRAAANALDEPQDLAVVAWLGYRSPGAPAVLLDDDARDGGHALVRLVEGLPVAAAVTTTVVAHSYGSGVAGRALRSGLRVDAVAVAGSPGMLIDEQSDVDTPIYALRAPTDEVAVTEWFGPDPSGSEFGATRLDDGDAEGHSEYFEPRSVSLRNLALVATGQAGAAGRVEHRGLMGVGDRIFDGLDWTYDRTIARRVDAVQTAGSHVADAASEATDIVQRVLPDGAEPLVDLAQERIGNGFELADRAVDLGQRVVSPDWARDVIEGLLD